MVPLVLTHSQITPGSPLGCSIFKQHIGQAAALYKIEWGVQHTDFGGCVALSKHKLAVLEPARLWGFNI